MGDLKKTFLAGFAVLLILLMAPYYLQLIGYNDTIESENAENVEETQLTPAAVFESKSEDIRALNMNILQSSDSNNSQTVVKNIISPLFQLTLSNIGGGSIESYQLSDTQQFLGGYNTDGIYQSDLGATLISPGGCAPCVGINTTQDENYILANNDWSSKHHHNLYSKF